MSTHTDFAPALPIAEASFRRTQFYWLIRRELWEHRYLWRAPIGVAALVLFASAINIMGNLPDRMRTLGSLSFATQHGSLVSAVSIAPAPIMFATLLVGMFYATEALYGERKDRSILFWKSLPTSDAATVLSKAGIPLVVLPLIAFSLSLIVVAVLLCVSTAVLVANGLDAGRLWSEFRFVQEPLTMIYGLAVHALWLTPLYAWLLLISAWAKRAPFLWAALPPLVLVAVESALFGSSHVRSFFVYRWTGAMDIAFRFRSMTAEIPLIDELSQLTPLRFLTTPNLWIGLLAAAVFLLAAARVRRTREPI